jgi:hypothetical protein
MAAQAGNLAGVVRRRLAATLRTPASHRALVLGLDVSTRAVGITALTARGELVATEVLTGDGSEHGFAMAAAVSERVHQLATELGGVGATEGGGGGGFAHVAVEDVLKSFATGRFQTQGLFTLARLNGMVCYELWRRTGSSVASVMPNTVRAFFNIKSWMNVPPVVPPPPPSSSSDGGDSGTDAAAAAGKQRKADDPTKVAVMSYVSRAHVDLPHTWTYTRTGSLAVTNYDRCDSVLTAMFGVAQYLHAASLRACSPAEAVELVQAQLGDMQHSRAAGAAAALKDPLVQAALSAQSADAALVADAVALLHQRWWQQADTQWGLESPHLLPPDASGEGADAAGDAGGTAPSAARPKRMSKPLAAAVKALQPVYDAMAADTWAHAQTALLGSSGTTAAEPLLPAWACRPPGLLTDGAPAVVPRSRKRATKASAGAPSSPGST